jgi:hypothetical protein
MRIEIDKLRDGTYQHSEEAENAVRIDIIENVGLKTVITNEPGKMNPYQDYGIESFTVEQKITTHVDGVNLELYRDAQLTTPSGFSLSTADLTHIIQHGNSSKYGPVWKCRLFRTKDLIAAADAEFMDGNLRKKQPIIEPWGAYAIQVRAWALPHVWLGEVPRDPRYPKVLDTALFVPNPKALDEFHKWFAPDMMELESIDYFNKYGTY